MKHKKIFVTGGAGFIGSNLVDKLLLEGNSVTVYDNLSSARKDFIDKYVKTNKVSFIHADLLDFDELKNSIGGHDFVFHLAANPDISKGIKITDTDLKQNTIATYNVLESMRLNNIKNIAFSSTSAIYGEASIIPTPESYGPLLPISLYGASKLACEGLITSFSSTFGIKSWIFRFANIIGNGATHGVIFDFIGKLKRDPKELEILGDGNQKKSYLLVDECIDSIMFAIENSNEDINIFNLGVDDNVSVNKIAEILINKLSLDNVKIKYTGGKRGWPGDVIEMILSTKKINALGWKSKYNSKQAVEKAIESNLKETGTKLNKQ